jgi:hypothetical protein
LCIFIEVGRHNRHIIHTVLLDAHTKSRELLFVLFAGDELFVRKTCC